MGRVERLLTGAALVLATACGAGDDVANEPADAGTAAPADQAAGADAPAAVESLTATLADGTLTLSKDSVPTGPVTILVRNTGTTPQGLRVLGTGDAEDWATDPVAPGADVSMSLNLRVGQFTLSRASADSTATAGPTALLRVF